MHTISDSLLRITVLQMLWMLVVTEPSASAPPSDDAQWLRDAGLGHLEGPLRQHGLVDPSVAVLEGMRGSMRRC